MNKQSRKRMFAQLIFSSLLLNSMASVLTLASTSASQDYKVSEQRRCGKKDNCCKQQLCCHKPEPKEAFDFVIVGAGNAGCVLANRLSEDGRFSVCVLEAGRDDARLPELLPEPSAANVPQPGDYQWGKYVRGATFLAGSLINRGFGDFHFYENSNNRPDGTRSMTYSRYAGWGGCTSHNGGSNARNAPYNWDQWVELGLTEWDASSPTSPIVSLYKKIENRSQALIGTFFPFYDPGFPGEFGGFDPAWYGFDGQVPMAYTFPDDYTNALLSIMNTTLSNFGYPTSLVDLDYPPTAADGGLGLINITAAFQILDPTVTEPDTAPASGDFSNNVPMPEYNFPLYGDTGFKVPEEFQDLNNPFYNPASLFFIQRVSSANTYLYAAEQRPNLTIKSEVLVTNLIIKDKKAQGVEYLEG